MPDKSILIIGDAGTGKTHYFAQLMLRLEAHQCAGRYFEPPDNVAPVEEAMRCLNAGHSASHTVGQKTSKVTLPIEFEGGARVKVEWPDYAGERLADLVRRRHGGNEWAEDARRTHAWIIFVRHDQMRVGRDLLNRPVLDVVSGRRETGGAEVPWMPQAQLIELLQMMLFLRRASLREPLQTPLLGVALSCYDSLPERTRYAKPVDALHATAPMLANFIEANWQESARLVFGLSALGKSLDVKAADTDFVDSGPAANGWVVTPDGKENPDLTWPLVELLRRP
jgi:hypothetical protein